MIDFYIIPMDTEIESLKLANRLRKLNYKVEIDMNKRKLKKSLDFANREKIPYVIVLGDSEIKDKSFKIKDMFNNREYSIIFDEVDKINDILCRNIC